MVTPTVNDIQMQFTDLKLYARNLIELMDVRVSYENRVHMSAMNDPLIGDGEKISKKDPRFLALLHDVGVLNPTEEDIAEAKISSSFTGICRSEKKTEKVLIKKMVTAFSGDHVTEFLRTVGIGDKGIARLAGEIGHPCLAFPHHWEPNPKWKEGSKTEKKRILVADEYFVRNVGKLWSYCGVGDSTRKRAKGMSPEEATALGNPRAKALVYVIASNTMMMEGNPNKNGVVRPRSPYRDVYDEARVVYDQRDWTPQHSMNAALRKVGKTILRDFWVAARDDLVDLGVLELSPAPQQKKMLVAA